jgi:hypothetical protein
MRYIRGIIFCTLFVNCLQPAWADRTDKPRQTSQAHLTPETRLQFIRLLQSEFVFVRMNLPQGEKGLHLNTVGEFTPGKTELELTVANIGAAAKIGERVMITNIKFTSHSIILEINGGPKKKAKWYERISIGTGGGTVPISKQDQNTANAKGSFLSLDFPEFVPEMDLQELRRLLLPVFDFEVKTSAQALADAMPPIVRQAMIDHHVLVGMDKDMVVATIGRSPRKIREQVDGVDCEEWIYGDPPEDVQFIRFVGDEVTQVKIMKVNGEKTVRTENEMPKKDGIAAKANAPTAKPQDTDASSKSKPTLRRPGEAPVETDESNPYAKSKKDPKPDPADKKPIPSDPPPHWMPAIATDIL